MSVHPMSAMAATFPLGSRVGVAARRRLRVMQVTDWLAPGGKERVAINLANLLPRDRYDSYLCTTRSSGPLERQLAEDVRVVHLDRKHTFSWQPIRKLAAFNAAEGIDVLHAHGSSLFVAVAASLLPPYPTVVWHDHYGRYRSDDRPTWLYRLAARRIGAVIAVNHSLVDWARHRLHVRRERVSYIPNFVCPPTGPLPFVDLPGKPGSRVVCVAHLRPQKDHLTLFRAFAKVHATVPDAHLIVVGAAGPSLYQQTLSDALDELKLRDSVSLLGQREDVDSILRRCDIGVLSSHSEGFPLALVEYGEAGLAAVSTHVGECAEVLDEGRAGLLVPPGDPAQLATALIGLLREGGRRRALGSALKSRVTTKYRAGVVIERVCEVYETVAPGRRGAHMRPECAR
jgi:glycosyltransferase involved in cell wall biosynthesis